MDSAPPLPKDRSEFDASVHSKLDLLRISIEELTKATGALSIRFNMFFLVPLAVCAMGVATLCLYQSKISEHSWLLVMMGCLAQFFGEGVKKVIEGLIPWRKTKVITEVASVVTICAALASMYFLTGCASMAAAYDSYNRNVPREFAIGADQERGAFVEYRGYLGPSRIVSTGKAVVPSAR